VTAGDVPPDTDVAATVVTGSRASAYWDEPWISELKAWLRRADEMDLPMLGVCFGHQVIADALGGDVEAMPEYEIGYRTVRHDGDSRLLSGVDEEFTVFTTHSDRVSEVPPGATRFAENDYGIHGFRRENVFAVQFHPEYDRETAASVTREKEGQLGEERIEAVLDGITEANYAAACEPKQLFDNFLGYVREQRTSAPADD
jgi:GMP synthase (glutamine-hydrolysing)